jgi:ABC-type glycerol-3-phosphate transport system permease component
MNSIFVTVVYTVIVLFLASLAAFAFSKFDFKGKGLLFGCLLATMMIPTELTIAPLYIVFSKIHWIDTYIVQIIPGVGNVFAMFLFKQYMDGIPDALIDAAKLDGCSPFQIYLRIMLPVVKPITGALTILVGLGKWNDYLWPTMMVNTTSKRPIMAVLPYLNEDSSAASIPWEIILAGCAIVSIPVIIIFQNQFMQSVTVGAVKE